MSANAQELETKALADDARALLNATAGMAELEKYPQTRKRLAAALENSQALYGGAQEEALAQADKF